MRRLHRSRLRRDIERSRSEVKTLGGELFHELDLIEKQLMGKVRSMDLEDIRPFMDDELGYTPDGVGYKLHLRVKTVVDRFFAQSTAVTQRMSDDIIRQLNSSESFLSGVGEGAFKSLGGAFKGISKVSPDAIKSTIFAARDTIGNITGYVYKFQPWEATKLAGAISKWAGPAGVAFNIGSDLWDAYKASEREQELREAKEYLEGIIKPKFKDMYDILSDDEKLFAFFAPQIEAAEKTVNSLEGKSNLIRENKSKLESIEIALAQFN